MSSHVKLHLGSNVLAMVNSPAHRNPTHFAAHSITLLNSVKRLDLTRRRMSGVMGILVDGWGGFMRLQPLSANWRRSAFSTGYCCNPTPDGSGVPRQGMCLLYL